ncbi:MAG: hypothetical protein Q4G09_08040 [Clostridia bacterium]|nr:hypothetical protein [Clostridia bacterium]
MNTLEKLKEFIGKEWDKLVEDGYYEMANCLINEYDGHEETELIIEDSQNSGYNKIAYLDYPDSIQFCFVLDENNIITNIFEN